MLMCKMRRATQAHGDTRAITISSKKLRGDVAQTRGATGERTAQTFPHTRHEKKKIKTKKCLGRCTRRKKETLLKCFA